MNYLMYFFHSVVFEYLVYVPPLLRFKSPVFSRKMYLCVSYGYQNKHRLLPFASLTDWSLQRTLCLSELRVESLYKVFSNISLPTQ